MKTAPILEPYQDLLYNTFITTKENLMETNKALHTMYYNVCIETEEIPNELSFPDEQFYIQVKQDILEQDRVIDRINYLETDSVVFTFEWTKEPRFDSEKEGHEGYLLDMDIYVTFFNKANVIDTVPKPYVEKTPPPVDPNRKRAPAFN